MVERVFMMGDGIIIIKFRGGKRFFYNELQSKKETWINKKNK